MPNLKKRRIEHYLTWEAGDVRRFKLRVVEAETAEDGDGGGYHVDFDSPAELARECELQGFVVRRGDGFELADDLRAAVCECAYSAPELLRLVLIVCGEDVARAADVERHEVA